MGQCFNFKQFLYHYLINIHSIRFIVVDSAGQTFVLLDSLFLCCYPNWRD